MAETPTGREKAAQAYQEKLKKEKEKKSKDNVASERIVAVGKDIRRITVLKNGNKHSSYVCSKKNADLTGIKYELG